MKYSYHFPIILGQDEAERVVMIHLSEQINDYDEFDNDYPDEDDEFDGDEDLQDHAVVNNNDTDADNKANDDQTQTTPVEDETPVNRVVIVSGDSIVPLFKIPKNVNLIDQKGRNPINGGDVDFTALHEIARMRKLFRIKKNKLEKEIAELESKGKLNKKQEKRLNELKESQAKLPNEESTMKLKISEKNEKIRQKTVFKVEVGGKIIMQKVTDDYFEYYVQNDSRGLFDNDVDFTLEFNHDGDVPRIHTGSVRIVRPAGENEIMKINVDLGSDATQVGYFYGAEGLPPDNVDMIAAMKGMYEGVRKYDELTEPQGKPLFIQQEEGKSEFYKTGNITFHKSEPSKNKYGCIDKEVKEEDTFINYLNVSATGKNEKANSTKEVDTWDKEKNFNKKLINLKMLFTYPRMVGQYANEVQYVHDGGVIPIRVNKRRSLMPVMRAIYKQIINASIATVDDRGCKYFSVLLLVPNIYVQQNIDYLLYELNKLNDLEKDVRYDFRAISESDAAFVGLKEMPTPNHGKALGEIVKGIRDSSKKDCFLIIDAGKGTTDYSIVYYNQQNGANNSTIPLNRHGIVGAGGAIDYVFARVFARQVYAHLSDFGINASPVNEEEFERKFMTMIQKLPTVDQDRMMLIAEHLKKKYGNGKTAKVYKCFESTEAQSIIVQLAQPTTNYSLIEGNSIGWEKVSEWSWDNTMENVSKKDTNEVEWVCKAIAGSIVKDIFSCNSSGVLKKIDFIIFTGRSFKFAPLKSAFENALQPKDNNKKSGLNFGAIKDLFRSGGDLKKATTKTPDCDMKTVAVYFMTHDLGMNCNSDLCCVDMLSVIDNNNRGTFELKNFWEGFDPKDRTDTKKRYYIGCPDQSFAPILNQFEPRGEPRGNEEKLINMTLFPVVFKEVELSDEPLDRIPTNNAATGNKASDNPSGQQGNNGLPEVDNFDVNMTN